MIKIAICDDDEKDRERLRELIQKFMRELEEEFELQIFASGEEFLENSFIPDILFLDILMNEEDGIQIGDEIKKKYPKIIIIYSTCLREKITAALNQIHSFGYLVKPINAQDLLLLLSDAVAEVRKNFRNDKVSFLSSDYSVIELSARDIYYFEYCDRKVKIVTNDKIYTCIKEKMNDLAEKMEKYGFVMSHQSYVVNIYNVNKIGSSGIMVGEKHPQPQCLC